MPEQQSKIGGIPADHPDPGKTGAEEIGESGGAFECDELMGRNAPFKQSFGYHTGAGSQFDDQATIRRVHQAGHAASQEA
jgi:hypothetical protein